MAVANRNLSPGDRFVATYKKQTYEAIVEQTEPLRIGLLGEPRWTGPSTFNSLSAAGSAVMGGIACNGWRFWTPAKQAFEFMAEVQQNTMAAEAERAMAASLPSGAAAAALTEPNTPAKGKSAPKPRTFRIIQRVPNQKGVAEGMVRYFCRACMDGFLQPVEAGTPDVCPNGHRTDDPELTSPATVSA